ncbi:UDP-2,3-diacylglucosamine diphosphatase [Halomonas sp. PR-M31]|uniref:UDP-2,3-diacylglucosamine diphosphatase n=1 Tax=Halomonas sp. PR-M31 TaxID=1471202 RepID=UPI00065225D9|nr:UDP-2,3-diacylglucosamine diphosphatase [Halomonas sp. PR-M31]
MTTLLISDLHLHPGAPEIARGFLDYLKHSAQKAQALYILGDLFEAWIGDDYHLNGDFEAPILEALKRLGDAGTQVYFMHGNRDFLIGEDFAKACGVTLLPDPHLLELDGKRILLMHGDSLCTRDEEYMKFRAMTRDPQWQAQILALPVQERLELARNLRNQSGEANSNKAQDIMDVTPGEVVKVMQEHQVRTLIHGHTHRPDVHALDIEGEPAKRFVLGDWKSDQGWDIRLENGGEPELRHFSY